MNERLYQRPDIASTIEPASGIASRIKSKMDHVMFTAILNGERSAFSSAWELVGPNVIKKERVAAAIHLLSSALSAVPKIGNLERNMHNRLNKPENIPFADSEAQLIGFGGESYVFRLGRQKPFVLKTDRLSIGQDSRQQQLRAEQLLATHKKITEWFEDVDGFVVPCHPIVAVMPYKNQPGVGTIQPYFENPTSFLDFTDEQICELFTKNPRLKFQFTSVATIIKDVFEQTQTTVDLAGDQNFCIIDTDKDPRLVLLDSSSILDVNNLHENDRADQIRTIQRISEILEKSTGPQPV